MKKGQRIRFKKGHIGTGRPGPRQIRRIFRVLNHDTGAIRIYGLLHGQGIVYEKDVEVVKGVK